MWLRRGKKKNRPHKTTSTCINLVVQMALWRVVIFSRHAFSSLIPATKATKQSVNIYRMARQVMVVIIILVRTCIYAQCADSVRDPIVYFVSHLTHIIYHIEWRYTQISDNCHSTTIVLLFFFTAIALFRLTDIVQKYECNLKGGLYLAHSLSWHKYFYWVS